MTASICEYMALKLSHKAFIFEKLTAKHFQLLNRKNSKIKKAGEFEGCPNDVKIPGKWPKMMKNEARTRRKLTIEMKQHEWNSHIYIYVRKMRK